MGKRTLWQRMGRGSPTFRSPGWVHVAPARYPTLPADQTFKGRIVELIHDPGRWVPLARVVLENGVEFYIPAPEGAYEGQVIHVGPEAPIENGNILPVGKIPEGTQIYNVEKLPGDGGKYARQAGSYALILGRTGNRTIIQLPSGKTVEVHNQAKATIGIPAGAGRTEKPLLKAGANYHRSKVKAWKYPRVRGVAMNAVSHAHGGGSHQSVSFPSTVSRRAPPGRKTGHIAARRTGRRKGAH